MIKPPIYLTNDSSVGTGIFPCQAIHGMARAGEITATKEIEDDQIQPASLDLRLGDYAYPVATSFLPGRGKSVLEKMRQLDGACEDYKIPLNAAKGALLEKNRVYVVPLMESIKLREGHSAFANPKSSTGRLDILTRLIIDGATKFDEVPEGYSGQLYVEIAPRSFSIVVHAGARLNQLRFIGGRAAPIPEKEWDALVHGGQIVPDSHNIPGNGEPISQGRLPFHIDLKGHGKADEIIGWRSKENAGRIDLSRRDYDPMDFWEPVTNQKEGSLVLDPNRFYILMTQEAIGVPPDYAAEMLPYDTRAGEFRVHYAGFFDPGFGWNSATGKAGGSRGVLEVRSHDVPFLLEHGQLVGWLKYERMATRPDCLYGQSGNSNYQGQSLKLAKQFKEKQCQ